jgi:hypothetical protein
MNKNYTLFAAAALFALVGANINAYTDGRGDWFEGMRRPEDRAVSGGQGRPVGVVFEEVETQGGNEELRLKPVEGALDTTGNILGDVFGGRRR